MATNVQKIDSNVVGLSYAEEETIGVLPVSPPDWQGLDPNGFSDFGGMIKTVARRPINPSRQRKKGVTTDLDANGGFGIDLTQTNIQELLQGFFFANFRRKVELDVATVRGAADDDYVVADSTGSKAGDLIFAKYFDDVANNGLKIVDTGGDGTHVPVTTDLTPATTQAGVISRVGFQFASADLTVDNGTFPFPALKTTVKDMREIGLIPGEWIYIGDDSNAAFSFAAGAAANGYARVRSVASDGKSIQFDKTSDTWVTNAGTAKTIRLFCGRVLRNESGSDIVRRTYQLERTLGAPDTTLPSQIQSEYVIGATPNEFNLNLQSADKITVDLTFVGTDVEQRTGAEGLKSGTHLEVVESDCFNTSSDMKRAKLSVVGNPEPLFAFFTDLKIMIKNNITPNKAAGVLGSFDVTAGLFEVGGTFTAYFSDNVAAAAVRDNEDITMDLIVAKANSGIAWDIPLLTLGDARPKVEIDKPIVLPVTMDAADGVKVASALDHSLLMVFFDYLPDIACA